jgi:hypothetical protein
MEVHLKKDESEPMVGNHYYVVAKNGVFLYKKNSVLETTLKVKNIPFLKHQEEVFNVKYPPLSHDQVLQIVSFFAKNYKKFGGESIVLLHYNPRKGYLLHAPEQRVAKGMLDYSPQDRFGGYLLAGSIHCHGSLMACHSQGHAFSDHEDEIDFDGLHITVGNVNSKTMTVSCSIMVNGRRFVLNPSKYMEGIKEVKIEKPVIEDVFQTNYPLEIPDYKNGISVEDSEKTVNCFSQKKIAPIKIDENSKLEQLYWAPATGRKNWEKLLKPDIKSILNRVTESKLGRMVFGATKVDPKEEKKEIDYLMNPLDDKTPFFFSLDIPTKEEIVGLKYPEEWDENVSKFPILARIGVCLSQLGGDNNE